MILNPLALKNAFFYLNADVYAHPTNGRVFGSLRYFPTQTIPWFYDSNLLFERALWCILSLTKELRIVLRCARDGVQNLCQQACWQCNSMVKLWFASTNIACAQSLQLFTEALTASCGIWLFLKILRIWPLNSGWLNPLFRGFSESSVQHGKFTCIEILVVAVHLYTRIYYTIEYGDSLAFTFKSSHKSNLKCWW